MIFWIYYQHITYNLQEQNLKQVMRRSKLESRKQWQKEGQGEVTAKKQLRFSPQKQSTKRKKQQSSHSQSAGNGPSPLVYQPSPIKEEIEQLYTTFLEQSQYTQASKAKATIKYLNDKEHQQRMRKMSQEHSAQKVGIKQVHLREMQYFREAWRKVFMQQAMKERMMLQRLDRLGKIGEEICKERIVRRCQSAKPTVAIAKLQQLQNIENSLRKRGQTQELRQLRREKRHMIAVSRQEQEKTLIRIAEQQRRHMLSQQASRYNSFMQRIERNRKQSEKHYRREEVKLKQKFKNIMRKLEHQQKKEWNSVTRNFLD